MKLSWHYCEFKDLSAGICVNENHHSLFCRYVIDQPETTGRHSVFLTVKNKNGVCLMISISASAKTNSEILTYQISETSNHASLLKKNKNKNLCVYMMNDL